MKLNDYPLYPLFTSPYRMSDLEKMKKKEARKAFDWFVTESPKRLELLFNGVERDTGMRPDFSEASLVTMWKWAIPFFTPRNTPPCGIELSKTGIPPAASNEGLHIVGLCLTYDIGYYLAEMIMRRCPEATWTLWERKTYPHNHAVLSGFNFPSYPHFHFSPRDIAHRTALGVLDGRTDKDDLLSAFTYTLRGIEKYGGV